MTDPKRLGEVMAVPDAPLGEVSAATMEALVVGGDLSKLTPAQRLEVYQARCHAAGLDPRTQPFSYLNLQGKLTLYATKTATDQLVATRKLSVQVADRKHLVEAGLYEVVARVTFPDGRMVEDVGVVSLGNLRGDAAANAIMKAITKAKRRTILSACGLGMLDETEADSIPGARVEPAASMHAVATTVTVEAALPVPAAAPAPAPAPAPDPVVVAEVVAEAPARIVDPYVASLDREAMNTEVGTLWRKLRMNPVKAKNHMVEVVGVQRANDMTDVQMASYLDILKDKAFAEGVL